VRTTLGQSNRSTDASRLVRTELSGTPVGLPRLGWWQENLVGVGSTLVSRSHLLWHWYRPIIVNWTTIVPLLLLPHSDSTIRFVDGDQLELHSPDGWAQLQNLARWKLLERFASARSIGEVSLSGPGDGRKRRGIEIRAEGERIVFLFERSPTEISYALSEIFLMNEYADLTVHDRTVVDIGTHAGDSCLYFLARGARKVYGFEASPAAYRRALENVEVNGRQSAIEISLAFCGSESGWIRIRDQGMTPGSWVPTSTPEGMPVEQLTLDDIVGRLGISEGALKVDCEGSEYALLRCTDTALQAFQEIILEYHYGKQPVIDRLRRAGFIIRSSTGPMNVGHGPAGRTVLSGLVHATRGPSAI
jgi:FkbM family methyltransferase